MSKRVSKRNDLLFAIRQQQAFIEENGGNQAGYENRYGVDGPAIFAADRARLVKLQDAFNALPRHTFATPQSLADSLRASTGSVSVTVRDGSVVATSKDGAR